MNNADEQLKQYAEEWFKAGWEAAGAYCLTQDCGLDPVAQKAFTVAWQQFEQNLLQREIDIGVEQADRGELGPLDAKATLARVRNKKANDE